MKYLDELEDEADSLEAQNADLVKHNHMLKLVELGLRQRIARKDSTISNITSLRESGERNLNAAKTSIAVLKEAIVVRDEAIVVRDEAIAELRGQVAYRDETVNDLRRQVLSPNESSEVLK